VSTGGDISRYVLMRILILLVGLVHQFPSSGDGCLDVSPCRDDSVHVFLSVGLPMSSSMHFLLPVSAGALRLCFDSFAALLVLCTIQDAVSCVQTLSYWAFCFYCLFVCFGPGSHPNVHSMGICRILTLNGSEVKG
jgi:hypothetical protein